MKRMTILIAVFGASCGGGGKQVKGDGAGTRPAAAAEPLEIRATDGPYASLAEYCAAAVAAAQQKDPESDAECWLLDDESMAEQNQELLGGVLVPTGAVTLAAPFPTARFVAVGFMGAECRLALETSGGWYVASLGFSCGDTDNRTSSKLGVDELAVRDALPGGQPELVARLNERESRSNMDNDGLDIEDDTDYLVLCGVGASGRPSCTRPLAVRSSITIERLPDYEPNEMNEGIEPGTRAYELRIEYAADGIVVAGDAPSAQTRIGHHPVAFP